MSTILLPQLPQGTTLVDQNGVTPPFIDYLDSLTSGVQKVINTYAPVGAVTDDNASVATVYPVWTSSAGGSLVPAVSSARMWFQPSSGTLQVTQLNGQTVNWNNAKSFVTTEFLNGQTSATFTSPQIAFGYSGTTQYEHFIHTRHDAAAGAASAIDFYTNDGTAAGVFPTNAVHNLSMVNGDIGIGITTPSHAAGYRCVDISGPSVGGFINIRHGATIDAQFLANSGQAYIGSIAAIPFKILCGNAVVWTVDPTINNITVGTSGLYGKGVFEGHHVEAYGAVGNGTTDDGPAIAAAFAAASANVNGSNIVRFGAKMYFIGTQMTFSLQGGKSVHLLGEAGKVPAGGLPSLSMATSNASGTILLFGNGLSVPMVLYSNTTSGEPANCHFLVENINFVNDINNISGHGGCSSHGLYIGFSTKDYGGNKNSVVRNCGFHQFPGAQILQMNARCIEYDNVECTMPGAGGAGCYGLLIQAEVGHFCGDTEVNSCTIIGSGQAGSQPMLIFARGGTVRGIHFSDCVFYYGQWSMTFDANAANSSLQDIFVEHCAFDGITGGGAGSIQYGINAEIGGANTIVNNIQIHDNYITSYPIAGVRFNNANGAGSVCNNISVSNNYLGICQQYGVIFIGLTTTSTCEGIHVNNNRFSDCGGGGGNMCCYLGDNVRDVIFSFNTHVTTGNPAPAAGIAYLLQLAGNCDWILINNNMGKAATGPILNGTTGVNIGIYNNFTH